MTQQILFTILRTIIAYFLLLFVTRVMGRKAVSQMTYFDFGVAITLGTVAGSIALSSKYTPTSAAAVLLTLGALAVLTGFLHTKSFFMRKIANSEPVVLIQNGEIVKENMKKVRLTLNELTSMLREKNTFNIADVEFAIFENDGKLSVEPKSQKQPLTPSDLNIPTSYKGLTKDLIIDGNIMYENLEDVQLDEQWLMDQLRDKGFDTVKDVFFAALDTSGSLYVSRGIMGREKQGEHGIE